MKQQKYGLTHLEKLANEIDRQRMAESVKVTGKFSLTVEFNTTEEPVNFMEFNMLVEEYQCNIQQVAARSDSIVAFFIEQEEA